MNRRRRFYREETRLKFSALAGGRVSLPIRRQRFFGLTVGTKVNCARWRDADDVRSKAIGNKSAISIHVQRRASASSQLTP